jgi:hypothetical protein
VGDELTKTTPTAGSAATYGYDNRGDRTSSKVGTATAAGYDYNQDCGVTASLPR